MKYRLVKIVDTREYIVIEGMFRDQKKYLPGTGIPNICAICGKPHEVHAYIESEEGQMIVGTGCAQNLNGLDTQLKQYELEARISELQAPGEYLIMKELYRGEWLWAVTLDGVKKCIWYENEYTAVKYFLRYKHISTERREIWKQFFSELYRLKKALAKIEEKE